MELSATLDTYRPNSAALFRTISANSKAELLLNEGNKIHSILLLSISFILKFGNS